MGSIFASTSTNIFMSEFKERCIYLLVKIKSSRYLRFISEIFMVWAEPKNQLKFLIKETNKKHYTIKLDFKFPKEKNEFLENLGFKEQNNRLQTALSKNPTDRPKLSLYKICTYSFTNKEYSLQPSIKNKKSLLNF